MQILAIEKDLKPLHADEHRELLKEEAARAWVLKKRGVLRDIWFTQEDGTAVLMLECTDAAEARQVLATLPLVRDGFIGFDVMSLQAYDGFERLMRNG